MPTWRIDYWRSCTGRCYVEAETEEQARQAFDEDGLESEEGNVEDGDEVRIERVQLDD